MQKSTVPELLAMRSLVDNTIERIAKLVREGYYVALILDVDHVLTDGRSDDIYKKMTELYPTKKEALNAYFAYESRLLLQIAHDGPWARVARKCGQLHQEQFIVTARSTLTSVRALNYALHHDLDVSWHYSVGSQSKKPSYRVALEDVFREHAKAFVFMIDDGETHCEDFRQITMELGLAENTEAIHSPRIRHYTGEELEAHYLAVMDPTRTGLFYIHEGSVPGKPGPRYSFVVCANGRKDYRRIHEKIVEQAKWQAIVENNRDELEAIAKAEMPDAPITDALLYQIAELLQT
jgi:hypothetical protein